MIGMQPISHTNGSKKNTMTLAEDLANAEYRLWQAIADGDLGSVEQLLSDELV